MSRTKNSKIKSLIFISIAAVISVQKVYADVVPAAVQLEASHLDQILHEFEAYVEQSLKIWQDPGMAVGIVYKGKIRWIKTYGTRQLRKNLPVTQDTMFPVASLTKNFTATLMGVLTDKGLIALDDPVKKYLPEFELGNQDYTDRLTIRDCLSHRTGLSPFAGDSFWNLNYKDPEIFTKLRLLAFKHPIGTEFSYQNLFYAILGKIAVKVTGKQVPELMREYLLAPLGMEHAIVGAQIMEQPSLWQRIKGFFSSSSGAQADAGGAESGYDVAIPHDLDENGRVRVRGLNPATYFFPASSGVNISVKDLCTWMLYQLHPGKTGIVSDNYLKEMTTAQAYPRFKDHDIQFPKDRFHYVSYGFGWFLGNYGEPAGAQVSVRWHMGGFSGVRSIMTIVPEWDLGIVVISNLGSMRVSLEPEALRNKFLDLCLGLKRDWSKEIHEKMLDIRAKNKKFMEQQKYLSPRPRRELQAYAGNYRNDAYGDLKVMEDDGKLIMRYRDHNVPLQHWNGDEFAFNASDLAQSYSGIDEGFVQFGYDQSGEWSMYVSWLDEGPANLFKRDDSKDAKQA